MCLHVAWKYILTNKDSKKKKSTDLANVDPNRDSD